MVVVVVNGFVKTPGNDRADVERGAQAWCVASLDFDEVPRLVLSVEEFLGGSVPPDEAEPAGNGAV
jgi:hypothetical protein